MFAKSLIALVMFVLAAAPAIGSVCACCAEPGTYMISTGKPESFEIDILKQIEFDKKADLYMTEAGFDSIKGLSAIEKDDADDPSWFSESGNFDLANAFTGKMWTFTFKTPKGKTGTLRLPIPNQMVTFKVDIHDGSDQGNGPLLYKEFRFKGTVAGGTGFLGNSIAKPTSYFLVFQGRGNGCDDVSDFKNWNLEITGKKARYQFFGKLGNTSSANKAERGTPMSLLTLQ